MNDWINCKARLPEDGKRYLGWDGNFIHIVNINTNDQWYDDYCGLIKITHWMPLPEFPREDE